MTKDEGRKIREFAFREMGIILAPYQVELIYDWTRGRNVRTARAVGRTTAAKVYGLYLDKHNEEGYIL